jgi:hypothetical protein
LAAGAAHDGPDDVTVSVDGRAVRRPPCRARPFGFPFTADFAAVFSRNQSVRRAARLSSALPPSLTEIMARPTPVATRTTTGLLTPIFADVVDDVLDCRRKFGSPVSHSEDRAGALRMAASELPTLKRYTISSTRAPVFQRLDIQRLDDRASAFSVLETK